MQFGPITLLKRMHTNGTPIPDVLIAALHWRRSITWRWSLTWMPALHGRRWFWPRAYFTRTYRGYPGGGLCFQAGLHVPILGNLHLGAQPNMWKA